MSNQIYNATLVDRQDVSGDLCIVRVQPDSGVVPEFKPGQFMTLGLIREPSEAQAGRPKLDRRAYSIASAIQASDTIEFYLVLVADGRLTPKLWSIPLGGRLWMDDKAKGHFTLEHVPRDRNLVMVATGTGLAPYMSMLRSYRGQNYWRRLVLIHGVRVATELGYKQELEQVCEEDSTVVYIPAVTREPDDSDWAGRRGRVQTVLDGPIFEALTGETLDPAHSEVFLCGNPAMIESVQADLQERGFVTHTRKQPGNLHFERYW